jgi:hypothetical protein
VRTATALFGLAWAALASASYFQSDASLLWLIFAGALLATGITALLDDQ